MTAPAARRPAGHRGAVRVARLVLAAAVLAGVALGAASCVPLDAAQLTVNVTSKGVSLQPPPLGYHGGETVITIQNYTGARQQFVLAQTNMTPAQFPRKLAHALTPSADPLVVDVSAQLPAGRAGFSGLIPIVTPGIATLHDYLQPGKRYVLFDRLGTRRYRTLYLVIIPPR